MTADERSEVKSYLEWSDKGRAGLGRYTVGLLAILVVFFILAGIGTFPVTILDPEYKDSLIESNVAILLAFVIPFIGIPLVTHLVHRRPFWSVGWPRPTFEGWNFWMGFLVSTMVGLLAVLAAGVVGALDLGWVGMDWSSWLPLFAIGLVGLFVQTSSEEMLFRGYLTQFVRRVTKNPWVFLTIPALLFAAPHISNVAALGGGPLVLVPYFASGLLYGWAAYRTGSLWMGIGLHFSNNLSGMVLVGTEGDVLKSVAPIQFTTPGLGLTTVLVVGQSIVIALLLEWMIRRRAHMRVAVA